MSEKDDLYEGLTIMSAEEVESSLATPPENEKPSNEEVEETNDSENGEDEDTETENKDTETPYAREVKYKALLSALVKEGIITVEDEEELEKAPGSLKTIKDFLNKTIDKTLEDKQDSWKKSF